MSEPEKQTDPRNAATGTIAGCGIGAFAISVVFGKAVGGGIVLPVLVIAGTALALAAVWLFGGSKAPDPGGTIAQLESRIAELEERLAAAETVKAFEERLAEKEAALRVDAAGPQPESD